MQRSERRDSIFVVRLTREERARVEAAAGEAGVKVSEWARAALLGAADPIPMCR